MGMSGSSLLVSRGTMATRFGGRGVKKKNSWQRRRPTAEQRQRQVGRVVVSSSGRKIGGRKVKKEVR